MAKNNTKTVDTIAVSDTVIPDLSFSALLSDLQAIQDKVTRFQALPCFSLLLSISNPLTIGHFVPSKGNTNPLNGKRDLFIASKYEDDLSSIAIPSLPDFDHMIGLANNIDPLDVTGRMRNDFLNTKEGKEYAVIRNLHITLAKIDFADIKARYSHFVRVQAFLATNNDASLYDLPIWDREIIDDLADVSQDVKTLFVLCHKKAFTHDPTIRKIVIRKGSVMSDTTLHTFNQLECNFESYAGILQILAKMKQFDVSKKDCSFFKNGLNEFVYQYSKRPDFDPFVLYLFLRKFDSNTGSKQNIDQTSTSFKDLYPSA